MGTLHRLPQRARTTRATSRLKAPKGQQALPFDRPVSDTPNASAQLIYLRGHRARDRAFQLYERASEIDDDPTRRREAEQMYRCALFLDPELAHAYTNLGNLLFRRGAEAEALEQYEKALALEPEQPEAHYNLGYLALESGHSHEAIGHLRRSIECDGGFADAHFNLATAYEQAGQWSHARGHWERYLELDARGAWAEDAKARLRAPRRLT